MTRRIKVLVVDDSVFFRDFLTRSLKGNPAVEVVGSAASAMDADRFLASLRPDVIVLDMEMPRMRGDEFIRSILLNKYPGTKAIVISGMPNNVFEALQAGALDFVSKPNTRPGFGNEEFIRELVNKIKMASHSIARPEAGRPAPLAAPPAGIFPAGTSPTVRAAVNATRLPGIPLARANPKAVIAIGASTGGTEAILAVIRNLPANMPGIVIVQHMPPVFTKMYAERLDRTCKMRVKEAEDGDRVEQGLVLIAPGDRQMQIRSDVRGYYVRCEGTEKVSGHCPSVDVLFSSVSKVVGSNAVGVILTGMGADGAKGLLEMKKAGANTIGQDQETCVVYGMPMVAYNIGGVKTQLPLQGIADGIMLALK